MNQTNVAFHEHNFCLTCSARISNEEYSELVDMYKFSLNVNQDILKMFWTPLLAVLQGKIYLCSYSHGREINFGPKVLRRYMLAYNFLPAIHMKGGD